MATKRIAIAVGGTGGHVLPAQIFGERMRAFADICYVGKGLTQNPYMRCNNGPVFDVEGGNFSRGVIQGGYKILKGFSTSCKILKREKIDHVVGFGSFHSLPVILSSLALKIPYSLVETNVHPGKVNRYLSNWAHLNMIHFDIAKQKLKGKIELIDYDFSANQKAISQIEARRHFGLDPTKQTILIFGGSQGAEVINKTMGDIATKLPQNCQVIHLTGKESSLANHYAAAGIPAYVLPFSSEMQQAWSASDLVICRAGAGALREMLIYEKPGILVPFPGASEKHQEINADFMEKEVQGAIKMDQSQLGANTLLSAITDLLSPQRNQVMRTNLHAHKNKEKRVDIVECMRGVL